MEQPTSSKLGKKCKAVYCHPAYLTSMQNTSWEMPGWMNHKLESRFPGKISTTSDMHMAPMAESEEGSSVHGIFQTRVLEWGAIAFSNWPMNCAKYTPLMQGATNKGNLGVGKLCTNPSIIL